MGSPQLPMRRGQKAVPWDITWEAIRTYYDKVQRFVGWQTTTPDETNDGERDREVAADGGDGDAGADGGETDGQRNGQRWLKDFSRQRGRGISLGSTVGSRLSCSFWKRTGRDGVSNVVP